MTKYEDDLILAKRLSLVTDSDRCRASSSDAPHAPLKSLWLWLHRACAKCEEFDEEDGGLDAADMTHLIRTWANEVHLVIMSCNAAEIQRSDDVFRAIDWYTAKLEASDKNAAACFKRGMNEMAELSKPKFFAVLKEKMEEQQQKYEAELAKVRSESTRTQSTPSVPALSLTSGREDTATATLRHTDIPMIHEIQAAFWKDKYNRLADQNAGLRAAKVKEPTVKALIQEEVDKMKQHYDLQMGHLKDKAERLADINAALRKQLQQRESISEKRKSDAEADMKYGGGWIREGVSPKKAKSE